MRGNSSNVALSADARHALNAICPYFTMFPLEFPLRALRAHPADVVLDPFCGRGTTLYAARYLGLRAIGIDCSPVAVAISRAKLAKVSAESPLDLAEHLLSSIRSAPEPKGDFWSLAYHPETLRNLCRLRYGLQLMGTSNEAVLLRAAVLGVLHGPVTRVGSYLSNQMPRTFAPKPDYAVDFWRRKRLKAPKVDVLAALERKLERVEMSHQLEAARPSDVHEGDSSTADPYRSIPNNVGVVVTSPPYYGMRTYVPDQWLRNWFMGGPAYVDYGDPGYLLHSSPADFAKTLGRTWAKVASRSAATLRLFVRFGAIPSRAVDAKALLLNSFEESNVKWRVLWTGDAGTADAGKRQSGQMRTDAVPDSEFDLHAVLA